VTKQRISAFTLAALVGLATAADAAAQTPDAPVRGARATFSDPILEALVSEALQTNADVAASVASAEAASFRIEPARTLPDPFLSFNYQNDGWAFSLGERDMTFLGAMFSQPLPWPGKLRLAGEEAELRAQATAGSVGRARLSVEARVRRAYYEYLAARELLALVDEREHSWREIFDVARDRYAAGIGAQQDVLRAQVEVLRLDEARADESARVANRRAELNRLLGRPQNGAIETTQRLEFRAEVPDFPALLETIRGRSPELAALRCGIEADRSRILLTKKEFLPDFVASGGPMYRGSLDPMWQVGLGVTLPIHVGSRLKPRLAEAEAELRAEQERSSSAALELELQTRERFHNLDAALRVARLYRDAILPTDQISLESAIATYRTAKVPFVTVLEALNTLYADRALLIARLADAEKWRISIDEGDLQPTGGMAGAAPSGTESGTSTMTRAAAAMATSAGMR
jgi:outer membrane protein, heavy metal efflux system